MLIQTVAERKPAAWYATRLDEARDNRQFVEREIALARTAADRAGWESELPAIELEIVRLTAQREG